MTPHSDTAIARLLLQVQAQGGPSYRQHFFGRPIRLALYLLYCVFCGVFFVHVEHWLALGFIAGLIVGAMLRDLRSLHYARRVWPFNLKVIDWAKVHELAEGDEPRVIL